MQDELTQRQKGKEAKPTASRAEPVQESPKRPRTAPPPWAKGETRGPGRPRKYPEQASGSGLTAAQRMGQSAVPAEPMRDDMDIDSQKRAAANTEEDEPWAKRGRSE
eukprot:1893684-Heterocapsa_arctica.AAC.1